MVDPRLSIIDDRLKEVNDVVAVASGKGGVGKSLVASVLALSLARSGHEVGLLDLDFTGPSTHFILGVEDARPREERGVIPPVVHGLRYMSITYYVGGSSAPLRGVDVSNALIEILSITRWGPLDYLIFDMPPGIGDVNLDLLRLVRRIRFVVVTTPSQLAFQTVRKLVVLLNELKIPIIGVIENMKMDNSDKVRKQTLEMGVRFLGEIPYDSKVEKAIGDVERLMGTNFAKRIEQIGSKMHFVEER